MSQLEELLRGALDADRSTAPLVADVGPTFAEEVASAQAAHGARIPAEAYQSLLHLLAAVHGFACLEVFGHLGWFTDQARDELLAAQVDVLVQVLDGGSTGG